MIITKSKKKFFFLSVRWMLSPGVRWMWSSRSPKSKVTYRQ